MSNYPHVGSRRLDAAEAEGSPLGAGRRVVEAEPQVAAGRPRLRARVVERTALIRFEDAEILFEEEAVRAVIDHAGEDLRWVANLVGGFAMGQHVAKPPIHAFEEQLRLNLRPTYLVTAAAFPSIEAAGGGAIVCVSSRSALRPFAGAAGYCTSKAAVATFAAVVAEEGKKAGVRCNAIVPSVIETPANREAMGPDAEMVPPAQIARVIAFLLSDDAAPTSGAAVPVYGRA